MHQKDVFTLTTIKECEGMVERDVVDVDVRGVGRIF